MSTSTQHPSGSTKTSRSKPQEKPQIEIEKNHKARPGLFNWKTLSFILAPGVLTGCVLWWLLSWSIQSLEPILTAITIFSGFLFALLIFVFQLRMQVHYDPRTQQRSHVPDYVNELFQITLYSTLYSVALTALIAGISGTLPPDQPLPVWLSAVLAGLLATFVFTLILICIRTAGAYSIASSGSEFRK